MPSGTFEVETYAVNVRGIAGGNVRRLITITSPALTHGIRTKARIWFRDPAPANKGSVFNVGGLNFNGITISGNMDLSDYEHVYHLLQTEKPVKIKYWYSSAGDSTTKALRTLHIFTGDEFPGEGEEDDSP